jgi:Tol biopolymer transport system component
MADLRREIRRAFQKEQVATPPPPDLRAQVAAAIATRERQESPLAQLAFAAVVLVTIVAAVALLAPRLANTPASPANPTAVAERCVAGQTPASDRFALLHGCITFRLGQQIVAVDPAHPTNAIVLWETDGREPIAWSRDGKHLLVQEWRAAGPEGFKGDLYVLNADGSEQRLTSDGLSWGGGSFSPDGTKVIFSVWNRGLYLLDVRGGVPRRLAESHLAFWLGSPTWSPDGSRIAYLAYIEGPPDPLRYEIWVMNSDGTDQHLLLDLGECGGGGCTDALAWSPDGSRLVFSAARGHVDYPATSVPSSQIYVVRADGAGLRRITNDGNNVDDVWPAWSPDGSRIAFVRRVRPDTWTLFTMAADGSDLQRVGAVTPAPAITWNPVR